MALDHPDVVRGSSAARSDIVQASRQQSRVTNGADIAIEANVDMRMPWPRRFKDLQSRYISDLGGLDATSTAKQGLIRRIVAEEIELERIEAKLAVQDSPSDRTSDLYNRMAGGYRRLLETLGIERVARDVTPSIDDILESADGARAARKAHAPGGSVA